MQTIYLDISNKGTVPTIYAKQGDVGRKFEAVLTDSGLPYFPVSGSVFSVWYSGTSGEGNYTDIGDKSAFIVNGNKVTVEMIVQMLLNNGEGVLSLVLNDPDGNQISTWNIPYICEHIPGAESEGAKTYYTALSKTIEELSNTQKLLEGKLSVDGSNSMQSDLTIGGNKITELGDPESDTDAVNLGYVNENFAPAVENTEHPGCYYRIVNGEVEWINPPMAAGIEYRTTERWNGKPVYTRLLNGGTARNNIFITLDAGCKIIREVGWLNTSLIPYGTQNGSWYARVDADDRTAYLFCSETFANGGYTWTHQFWYVKD